MRPATLRILAIGSMVVLNLVLIVLGLRAESGLFADGGIIIPFAVAGLVVTALIGSLAAGDAAKAGKWLLALASLPLAIVIAMYAVSSRLPDALLLPFLLLPVGAGLLLLLAGRLQEHHPRPSR